jgi:hypothetical protein
MPGNIGCHNKVLEFVANKAGAPWQAGHRGDLTIGGTQPVGMRRTTAQIAAAASLPGRGAVRSNVRFGGIGSLRGQEDKHSVALPWPGVPIGGNRGP